MKVKYDQEVDVLTIECHAKEPKDHLKEGMIGKLIFK